jgi:hypothetical protein
MSSKKFYYLLLGIMGLLFIALLGGAYGTNKLLAGQSKKLEHSRLQAAALSQQQDELVAAKRDIKKYQSLYNISRSIVPQDKDQAQTVREIVNIASQNGIKLSSVTFPASTLGGSASSTTTQSANTSTTTSQNALSQLTPVKDIKTVYELPITVQSDPNTAIPYEAFLNFLSDLEQNRRTALVNSITILPTEQNPDYISFTLILNEYIKP